MTAACQNCDEYFEGNYCNNCGQSAGTHKINFHFLWHDIQHGLLHFDKGLLFTAKELFRRPGHAIREFIAGKRVKHFKPISLVLLLAGVTGFLYQIFHINILISKIEISGSGKEFTHIKMIFDKLSEWVAEHYAMVALAELPIFSLSTFLAFRKSGYNFVEHLVLNAFLTGQRLLLHLFAFPLFYLYNDTRFLATISRIVDSLGMVLIVVSLMQFFNKQKKLKSFFQALLSLLIFIIITYGLLTILVKVIISTDT